MEQAPRETARGWKGAVGSQGVGRMAWGEKGTLEGLSHGTSKGSAGAGEALRPQGICPCWGLTRVWGSKLRLSASTLSGGTAALGLLPSAVTQGPGPFGTAAGGRAPAPQDALEAPPCGCPPWEQAGAEAALSGRSAEVNGRTGVGGLDAEVLGWEEAPSLPARRKEDRSKLRGL